jgi:hypothetical protein
MLKRSSFIVHPSQQDWLARLAWYRTVVGAEESGLSRSFERSAVTHHGSVTTIERDGAWTAKRSGRAITKLGSPKLAETRDVVNAAKQAHVDRFAAKGRHPPPRCLDTFTGRLQNRQLIAFAAAPICGHDRGPQLVVMRSPERQNPLRNIKNLALFSI